MKINIQLVIIAAMMLVGTAFSDPIHDAAMYGNLADVQAELDKGVDDNEAEPFIGQEALRTIAENGSEKHLVGLKLDGRRSPRQHMKVLSSGNEIGEVTSGCLSPTFNYPIAMAYVPSNFDGDCVDLDFGKTTIPATIVDLPFYKLPK